MQIQITKIEIENLISGHNLTLNITCWPDGDPQEEQYEIINENHMFYIKGHVEGKTKNDLIDETEVVVIEEFQYVIDKYTAEKTLFDSAKMDTMISNIQSGLEG